MCSAIIRIKHDMKEVHADPWYDSIAQIEQASDRPLIVTALLVGPLSSSHEPDIYQVTMDFPETYPISPPTVTIHGETNPEFVWLMEDLLGEFLREHWTATKTIKVILDFICFFLRANPVEEETLVSAMQRSSIA